MSDRRRETIHSIVMLALVPIIGVVIAILWTEPRLPSPFIGVCTGFLGMIAIHCAWAGFAPLRRARR